MVRRGEKKSEVRELQIDTVGGDRHVIGIESGPPLLGVWNVLKNLGKRPGRDGNSVGRRMARSDKP